MTRTETNTTLLIDRTELQQPMTAFQDFFCNKTLSSSKWMEHGNGISAYHDQTKILDGKKIDKNSESKNWGYFRQLTMPVVSCLVADKPVLVGESCILLLFFTIFLIMTANIVKQVMEVVKDYSNIYDKKGLLRFKKQENSWVEIAAK